MFEFTLNTGRYQVQSFVTDRFRLDGGAMFGSVPKTLWNKLIPADEKNRIQLVCRLLLVSDGTHTALIDVGMGRKWRDKERDIYAIEHLIPGEIGDLFAPTDVILTHLHFDHAGGISRTTDSGEVMLSFPNARTVVSQKNFTHGSHPGLRERASYIKENIEPILTGDHRFSENNEEVLPGITVHQAHGHTPGLQWIKITDEKDTIVYPADLIPTASHIQIPYVMGYDLCAETAMAEKSAFLHAAVAENWLIVFEHDSQCPAGRVSLGADGKFVFSPFQQ